MSIFTKEKSRTKRSVDLSSKTDTALDSYRLLITEKHGVSLSRGAAIDSVLGVILNLEPPQAYQLLIRSEQELRNAQALLDATSREDVLSRQAAVNSVTTWTQICELLGILADGHQELPPMRSIQMNGCRVLVPDAPDWITVDEGEAISCSAATIVEVRNAARFDMPHFIYFDNNGKSTTDDIDKAVLAVYPRYKEVLKAPVEPIRDANGRYLNIEELKNASWPEYFPVLEHDKESSNPYGVVLIPDKRMRPHKGTQAEISAARHSHFVR